MTNPPTQQHENPRTTRVRQVILNAAADLLIKQGAGEVTAARIAQETGVARTTIYRQWPDQADLLLDTIDSLVAPHSPTISTDDLEADLVRALSNLRTRMTRHPFRQVFAALLDLANQDRSLVAAQRRFVNGVLQPINDILTAAAERNDVPSGMSIPQACATLAGPLLYQHVMLRETIEDQLITNTVRQFLATDHETRQL